jgi:hypothetical protein
MGLGEQLGDLTISLSLPPSGGLKTKNEVDYRPAEDDQRCDRCDYYRNERCDLVAGRILPHGTCDLWSDKP